MKPYVVKLPKQAFPAVRTPLGLTPRLYTRATLEIRHDPQTLRWMVVLCSRTTKEDVVVAWKQTEADAAAWAENYGAKS